MQVRVERVQISAWRSHVSIVDQTKMRGRLARSSMAWVLVGHDPCVCRQHAIECDPLDHHLALSHSVRARLSSPAIFAGLRAEHAAHAGRARPDRALILQARAQMSVDGVHL